MKSSKSSIAAEIWFIAVLLVLGLSSPLWSSAWASEGKGGACRADAEKFCKDVKPGGGRIVKCLKEHEGELSPECREKSRARVKAVKEACHTDLEKFCKDVKVGGGRKIHCLKEHEGEVSAECKSTLEKKRGHAEQD